MDGVMDSVYTILKRMIKTGYLMRDYNETIVLLNNERIMKENRGDLHEKINSKGR
jgi:hypothetical protein